jgi:hypothetical protein
VRLTCWTVLPAPRAGLGDFSRLWSPGGLCKLSDLLSTGGPNCSLVWWFSEWPLLVPFFFSVPAFFNDDMSFLLHNESAVFVAVDETDSLRLRPPLLAKAFSSVRRSYTDAGNHEMCVYWKRVVFAVSFSKAAKNSCDFIAIRKPTAKFWFTELYSKCLIDIGETWWGLKVCHHKICYLKVPKCKIFHRSDFHDFYSIKPFWVGAKI